MHKIVINQDRGSKKKKDQIAIGNIWRSLDLVEVKKLAETLTKKEQKAFNQYCVDHGLVI
ncbi:MAG: hypothetical protein Q4C46_09895 [Bacillota bacterium]|nr:hypothetical protein [Bacillota bacterium]